MPGRSRLTDATADDATTGVDLLAAGSGDIARVTADGAYDTTARHRHLPVPRPLLAAVDRSGAGLLISEALDAPNLHDFHAGGPESPYAQLAPRERRQLLRRLGRSVRRMHEAEVSHRDLKAPNWLIDAHASEGPRVWLADLEGARIRHRPIPWARRARDLARLDASLDASRTDRLRALRAYLGVPPWPGVDRRRLLAVIARHVARKRGPAGRPR